MRRTKFQLIADWFFDQFVYPLFARSITRVVGRNVPPAIPTHVYGPGNTIHQSHTIDIQVGETSGEVQAVWFRCLSLPFRVSHIPDFQRGGPIQPDTAVMSISYVDKDKL